MSRGYEAPELRFTASFWFRGHDAQAFAFDFPNPKSSGVFHEDGSGIILPLKSRILQNILHQADEIFHRHAGVKRGVLLVRDVLWTVEVHLASPVTLTRKPRLRRDPVALGKHKAHGFFLPFLMYFVMESINVWNRLKREIHGFTWPRSLI
jgi:hypothetical protein